MNTELKIMNTEFPKPNLRENREKFKALIYQLFSQGLNFAEIGRRLGRSRERIRQIIRAAEEKGKILPQPTCSIAELAKLTGISKKRILKFKVKYNLSRLTFAIVPQLVEEYLCFNCRKNIAFRKGLCRECAPSIIKRRRLEKSFANLRARLAKIQKEKICVSCGATFLAKAPFTRRTCSYPHPCPGFVSLKEAAKELNLCTKTLRERIKKGFLIARRSGRHYIVRLEEIERFKSFQSK